MPVSAQPNDINAQGIPTAIALDANRPTLVNYIQGFAKVPADLRMVKDVEFGAGEVTFVSVTGKRVIVPVNLEFVLTGIRPVRLVLCFPGHQRTLEIESRPSYI